MAGDTPAMTLREMILRYFFFPTPPESDPDPQLFERCERVFYRAKQDLEEADELDFEHVADIQTSGFAAALGLLTFGRLDGLELLMDWMPANVEAAPIGKVAGMLREILPLPAGLHPRQHPDLVRAWIQENKHRLVWDDRNGIYVLSITKSASARSIPSE